MSTENRITAAAEHMATPHSRLKTAYLDAPAFTSKNPLLPNTADDAPNQLPKHLRGTDLTIDGPAFDQRPDGRRGMIKLFWNGEPVGAEFTFTTPITTFPVELTLPASETNVQGRFSLSYLVNLVGNITPSLPLEVNIDTTAPNDNQPGAQVVLPAEVEAHGITKKYLDVNGGKVVVSVRGDYADARINDVVRLLFGPSIPLAKEVGIFTRTDLSVPVTIDLLETPVILTPAPSHR